MSYYILCTNDAHPCHQNNQTVVSTPTANDYAALGITSASVGTSFAYGFGFVFAFAVLGLVVRWIVTLINRA